MKNHPLAWSVRHHAGQVLERARTVRRCSPEAESGWDAAAADYGGVNDLDVLERQADIETRFMLSLFATHYW